MASFRQILRRLLLGDLLLEEELQRMSQALDALTAQVAQSDTVMNSAAALITGLAAAILHSKDDPAALTQLAADLQNSSSALSAAVSQGTAAENLATSAGTPAAAAAGAAPTVTSTTTDHPETGVPITTTVTTDPTTGVADVTHTTPDPTTGDPVPVNPTTGEIVPPAADPAATTTA